MKYFFVTGSSKGIGLALVRTLLEEEDNVVIGLSRNSTLSHERYKHVTVDLSDIVTLQKHLPDIFSLKEEAEKVVLVNNAGTLGQVGYMGELENLSLPEVYNINLIAPALLINSFLRTFKEARGKAVIINISSGAGGYPVDGWSGYCATKAGLNLLSDVIAKEQEIRGSGVKIFSLAPGVVDTGMQEKIRTLDEVHFSGVQKFINLKNNEALSSTTLAAEKIIQLIKNADRFNEVMQDVRDF